MARIAVPVGSKLIKYVDFARAFAKGRTGRLSGKRPSICPFCTERNAPGVYIVFNRRFYCIDCAPRRRMCSRCRSIRSLSEFRTSGKRVESPCAPCIREKNRDRYHEAKGWKRATPDRKRCSGCGVERTRRFFAKDGRYTSGLDPYCLYCRKEQWQSSPAAQERARVRIKR